MSGTNYQKFEIVEFGGVEALSLRERCRRGTKPRATREEARFFATVDSFPNDEPPPPLPEIVGVSFLFVFAKTMLLILYAYEQAMENIHPVAL